MALTDLAPSQHADTVRDHWWWRPGWREGRSFYTWHITVEGSRELYELADRHRRALTGLPVTLVPDRWLHLTMQGVGFTDEVRGEDVDAIADAARRRLAGWHPIAVELGPAVVSDEAVALPATPTERITRLRREIRAAVADVWGAGHVPENADRFRPHVSVAYIDAAGESKPLVDAVARVATPPAAVTLRSASLIRLNRDRRMYEWETVSTLAL
jgi:2'-5' RNA ligase